MFLNVIILSINIDIILVIIKTYLNLKSIYRIKHLEMMSNNSEMKHENSIRKLNLEHSSFVQNAKVLCVNNSKLITHMII